MNHICYSKAADQQSYLLDEEDFLLNKSGAQASVDYKGYRLSLSSYLMMVLNSPKDYIAYQKSERKVVNYRTTKQKQKQDHYKGGERGDHGAAQSLVDTEVDDIGESHTAVFVGVFPNPSENNDGVVEGVTHQSQQLPRWTN